MNHFVPFTENEVGAKEAFKSDFMVKFMSGKIKPPKEKETTKESQEQGFENADFYVKKSKIQHFIPDKPLKFSVEAKAIFDAGREIWRYYHKNARENDYNANASLYDIKEYFQGRSEAGRMNARSADENYNGLMANLRLALKQLAAKITPKIYEYGFLRA